LPGTGRGHADHRVNSELSQVLNRSGADAADNDHIDPGLRQHCRNHAATATLRHRQFPAIGKGWRILLGIANPEASGLAEMLTELAVGDWHCNTHAMTPWIKGCNLTQESRGLKPPPINYLARVAIQSHRRKTKLLVSCRPAQNLYVWLSASHTTTGELHWRLWIKKPNDVDEQFVNGEQDHSIWRVILDSVADGVFTVDREWRITSFNRAAEQITGVPRAEAIGKRCCDVFRASICENACVLRRTLETGRPAINQAVYIIDAQGQRIPISISTAILRNPDGQAIGGVETFRDLS